MPPTNRHRSWWGWGYEDAAFGDSELDGLASLIGTLIPDAPLRRRDPPRIEDVALRTPRVEPPPGLLGADCAVVPGDRARHAKGSSYRDVVRALDGRIDHPPDLVAYPRTEGEVGELLAWCAERRIAVVPFGGGTSVVGGTEPDVGGEFAGSLSLDLAHLTGVAEVDELSLAARIGAGTLGPEVEAQLRPYGLTLRHFPQSFECSTVGGWLATRAAGHFATGPTHIDDLVESLRVVTPAGVVETRRLPSSGAGPAPDRLFLGSEGAFGVLTEAWLRVRARPVHRAGGTVGFGTFEDGSDAVRLLVQSGLAPANCRLVDATESLLTGAGDGSAALLIVGFESAAAPVDGALGQAADIVRGCGGTLGADWGVRPTIGAEKVEGSRGGWQSSPSKPEESGSAAWRRTFLRAPYLRDALVRLGMLSETFETAITWERLPALVAEVSEEVRRALTTAGVVGGVVTCRLTHAYPDGAAPYFTVLGATTPGGELSQWDMVKAAASAAVLDAGGTITHHHAVGRDHRHWYTEERSALVGSAFSAVKRELDPAGICNPGVLGLGGMTAPAG